MDLTLQRHKAMPAGKRSAFTHHLKIKAHQLKQTNVYFMEVTQT